MTTTMQIQPAYSQATHCVTTPESSSCVTTGKNPSITINSDGPFPIDGKTAGERIGTFHRACGQNPNVVTCTVTHP
jgi:hypothetical protein